MIEIILICLFLIAIIVIKVVKLKQVINKRLLGEKLTFDDLKKFNSWSFNSFRVDKRITPYGNKVYVVYRVIGLLSDKLDLDTYDDFQEATKGYSRRTIKEIDKIIYSQYSNQKVERIC